MIDVTTYESILYLVSFVATVISTLYFYLKDIRDPKRLKSTSFKIDYVKVIYGELATIYFNILEFSLLYNSREKKENIRCIFMICKDINFNIIDRAFFNKFKILVSAIYKDKGIETVIDASNDIVSILELNIDDCDRIIQQKIKKNSFMSRLILTNIL